MTWWQCNFFWSSVAYYSWNRWRLDDSCQTKDNCCTENKKGVLCTAVHNTPLNKEGEVFLSIHFFWHMHAPRVHKNKSMQHHTSGSGTAEFQVTWPPKLREGTYLVKNVWARFEYRNTIAAHEKQVIMQEKAQPCASLWRKTLRPKRVRFLAIDAPIVDYVCLPLYHLSFLGSYQPLCEFSWRKKKEKAR